MRAAPNHRNMYGRFRCFQVPPVQEPIRPKRRRPQLLASSGPAAAQSVADPHAPTPTMPRPCFRTQSECLACRRPSAIHLFCPAARCQHRRPQRVAAHSIRRSATHVLIRSGVRITECCVHPSVVAAPSLIGRSISRCDPGPACGWCLQGPIGWPRNEAGHDGRAGAPLPAAAGFARPWRRATCACIFALEVADPRSQCCMSTAACLKAVRQQDFATSRSPRHAPGPAFPCAVNPDPRCPAGVWLRRPPLAVGMSFC